MPRQSIEQATCTECDDEDAEFRVLDKSVDIQEDTIEYDVRCSCNTPATVTIDAEGVSASDTVSFDDASWNQDDEEDEDSDD